MENYIPQTGDFCGLIYLSKRGYKHAGKYIAMVDMEDYERINQYDWTIHNLGYAFRQEDGKNIMMHAEVLQPPDGFTADHIDPSQKRNNTKANLRPATPEQQARNRRTPNEYKGVTYRPDRGVYQARISYNHRQYHIGHFKTAEEAARAYDQKALEIFGEFAQLNFPNEVQKKEA